MRSTWPVPASLKEGGDVVMIIQAHEGQNLHQYGGQFGTEYGGRGWAPGLRSKLLAKAAAGLRLRALPVLLRPQGAGRPRRKSCTARIGARCWPTAAAATAPAPRWPSTPTPRSSW